MVTAVAFLALFALLMAASATDIRSRTIPNRLVLAVAALWLLWRCAYLALGCAQLSDIAGDVLGALLFGGGLLVFVLVSERMSGHFMMGGGDVKLLAAVSLFLGLRLALVALLAACAVSLVFAAARSKRGIPFAPCIMCGTLVALLV